MDKFNEICELISINLSQSYFIVDLSFLSPGYEIGCIIADD